MKRSHSRSTYPFDKPLPRELSRWFNSQTKNAKKVVKSLQISKQRSYNKQLCKDARVESGCASD